MKKIILVSILFFGSNLNLFANNVAYLKKSCDNGDAEKCFKLGSMYRDGTGTKINYPNAIKYYSKACDNGYAMACNNLGVRYLNGQGAKENKEKAVHFFVKACDDGVRDGCENRKGLKEYSSKTENNK